MTDWRQGWDDVVAKVGAAPPDAHVRWGADAVERGAVRRYVEPLELASALHRDPDVARQHGYDDVIAPYTSTLVWTVPPLWSPGQRLFNSAARDAQPVSSPVRISSPDYPASATGYFATDMSLRFSRPPVVGDRLGRRPGRLVDVAVKETRVGRGAFLTTEYDVVDRQDDPVATGRSTVFVYEPGPAGAPRLSAPLTQAPVPPPVSAADEPAAVTQRALADITPGQLLPPVEFPLPVYRLVMEAGVNRDFNSIHHNSEYAKASGAAEMYANTLFLQGMWERAVREFIGDAGTIREMRGFRMNMFNTVGETVVVHGKVEDVRADGNVGELSIAVWSTTSAGVTVGPGVVVATVPRGT